jgi:hypothetical protein
MEESPSHQLPVRFAVEVPADQEAGVFADVVALWHTPNTFVLDFLAVTRLPRPVADASGTVSHAVTDTRVAARVRIPPEQVFRLIAALQEQGEQWLEETGRRSPPAAWLTEPADDDRPAG